VILTVTLNASLDKTYSVPGFAVGRDVVAAHVECSPGGKGLNVASFARSLGAEALATGILGGHTGRHVLDLLAARGIAHDFVWIQGESRSCHIIYDPDGNTLTQIREPGPRVPPGTRHAVAEKLRQLAARAQVVVMSGSLPPGLESDTYRELVALARAQQVPVILDTAGEPLALGLEAGPTLIKPNWDELRELARRLEITGAFPETRFTAASGRGDGEDVRRWAAAVAQRYTGASAPGWWLRWGGWARWWPRRVACTRSYRPLSRPSTPSAAATLSWPASRSAGPGGWSCARLCGSASLSPRPRPGVFRPVP